MSIYERSASPILLLEYWKPIVGFDNYEVSNTGKIRNVRTLQILKPLLNRGYPAVSLCICGKRFSKKIHNLVAEAFFGNKPKGIQVNHIDGNKCNNRVSNLEYVTPKENIAHAIRLGLSIPIGLYARNNAKLSEAQVRVIRATYRNGNARELGLIYGVTAQCIRETASKKTWKSVA